MKNNSNIEMVISLIFISSPMHDEFSRLSSRQERLPAAPVKIKLDKIWLIKHLIEMDYTILPAINAW
jgi:hypothetical protein